MDYDNLKNLLNVICDYERIGDNPKIDFKNDTLYISNIQIKSMKANDISLKNITLDFDNVTFSVDLYELLEKFYEVSEERLNITKEIRFNSCEFFQDTSIENSTFQESCIFKDSGFRKVNATFSDTIFNKGLYIDRTRFDKELCFHECKFYNEETEQGLGIQKATFNYLAFGSCILKGMHINNTYFCYDTTFACCDFNNIVSITNSCFLYNLNLSSNKFEKFIFENSFFKPKNIKDGIFYFKNNIFNGDFQFLKNNCNCNILFEENTFTGFSNFDKTFFRYQTYFKDSEFLNNSTFKNIIFFDYIYFNNIVFHKTSDFSNSIFHRFIDFFKSKFNGAVYFDEANFQSFINMSNCTINDVMSFYDAKLYYTPYLAGANVDKNAKFNLMYVKQDENNIEKVVDEYNTIIKISKNIQDENTEIEINKLNIVKGFRESFRIFKSSLISQHNLLDASFYRVNELKAKELEMDLMRDKLSLSESLENILFKIYKNTSNHHSDLLRILCFTLCMAGLYIIMSCLVTYAINTSISFAISAVFFGLVCFRYRYCKKDYLQLWFWGVLLYVVFWSIVFDVLTMFCFGVFVFMVYVLVFKFNHIAIWFIGALIGFILVMYNPQTILPLGGIISQDLKNYHLNKAILNLDEITSIKLAKTIDVTISTELKAKQTLLDNVKVLNDSVFDEYASLKNAKSKDNTMQKINFIYYLMMILCLFSLQKTARKNSIMPN